MRPKFLDFGMGWDENQLGKGWDDMNSEQFWERDGMKFSKF